MSVPLLPGESVVCSQGCYAIVAHNSSPGTIHLTTYKLCFVAKPDETAHSGPVGFDVETVCVQAPLGVIAAIDTDFRSEHAALVIDCKDFRSIRIEFETRKELEAFASATTPLAFPKLSSDLFAFKYAPERSDGGWGTFDAVKEYERMGITTGSGHWRVSEMNATHQICNSYPALLVVPSAMTDAELEVAARFRRRQRFPVVCWRNKHNRAVLFRSSQPMVGIFRHWSREDEAILRNAVDAMGDGRGVHVFDCRSPGSAAMQTWVGGGREVSRGTQYGVAQYEMLEIENCEAQQEMMFELKAALKHLDTKTLRNLRVMAALCGSRWSHELLKLLAGAARVAAVLAGPSGSVLVHCNDGWNRTPQVVALAQLLIDPYYRTLDGFEVLIEKEWVGGGHCFSSRLGHGGKRAGEAPIWVQFLDCVWQLLQARPSAFEFGEPLLVALADAAWACRHGTFLFDSPALAEAAEARARTVSVWADLRSRRPSLLNPRYKAYPGLLKVHFKVEDLQVWGGLYLRYLNQDWHEPLPPDPLCPERAPGEEAREPRVSDGSFSGSSKAPHAAA